MRKSDTGAQPDADPAATRSYVRFIIVCDARTGSSMLVQALNSSPSITCFREVFNGRLDFIDFSVNGYDNFRSRDIESRKKDPVRFLRERVYCRHPGDVRAVGFKFLYDEHWDFPGLLEDLAGDNAIKVLHLRRRNLLRMLVSLKLAEETGVWVEPKSKLTRANLLKALRHPLKATGRIARNLRRPERPSEGPRAKVTVTPDELLQFSVETDMKAKKFDEIFGGHQVLPVFYEDLVDDPGPAYGELQTFLGVAPVPLQFSLRRQNPEPLRDLIENYDELHQVLKESPVAAAWMEAE